MTFFVTAQTAFRFITAHFVHHCTLKQALLPSSLRLTLLSGNRLASLYRIKPISTLGISHLERY